MLLISPLSPFLITPPLSSVRFLRFLFCSPPAFLVYLHHKTRRMKNLAKTLILLSALLINNLNAQSTAYSFKTAGAVGDIGPTQAQIDSVYISSNLFGVKASDGIQTWTVPVTGIYRIEAKGAQGGGQAPIKFGGKGASMRGDFNLTAGTVLKILVGQQGSSGFGCYGGGGGSFVTDSLNTPLVVAGGGGGAGGVIGGNGVDASIGLNGTAGVAGGTGGINGNGGDAINTNAGSGGGFYSDGTGTFYIPQCSTAVGSSFINGGKGGQFDFWLPGGFGGGGSGWDGNGNGGGGGGYSGGGTSGISFAGGGGGGSFNSGTNQLNFSGANSGDGEVIITEVLSTGIGAINNNYQINLYPNPNNGSFIVELPDDKNAVITVRNVLGQTILSQKAGIINSIALSEIQNGVYQLSVSINGTMICNKPFVKQ